jgi:bloom syndrome protein
MAVRMTPKKKIANPPTKAKRKTKNAGANQTGVAAVRNLPLSTNVSSPVQAASKRCKGRSFVDDEDDDEEDAFDPLPRYSNGYARDSFIVADDEDDANFVPLREAGRTKQKKTHELGPPITKDATMDRLSDTHRELVADFVDNAKDEGRKIRQMHNLRSPPFSDTILRQMAVRLVSSKRDLLHIPDINPEMVNLHGDTFLMILRNLRAHTGFHEDNESDDDEQRPMDPNHQNVIDLVSDDEEDDEYGGDSAFEDEDGDDEPDGPSPHFQMPAKPAAVMKFNQKFTQAQESVGKKPVAPNPKKKGKRDGARGYRKTSGGGRPGKKQWSKKKGASAKRASGGGEGNTFGGGIGMMPI